MIRTRTSKASEGSIEPVRMQINHYLTYLDRGIEEK